MQEFYKELFSRFGIQDPIICDQVDKNKPRKKFQKEKTVQYSFYCRKIIDKEIIDYLANISNKRQYFINLVKKDIEESKKK